MIVILGPDYGHCERFVRAEFPYYGPDRIAREFLFVWDAQSREKLRGHERGHPYINIGCSWVILQFAKERQMREIQFSDKER